MIKQIKSHWYYVFWGICTVTVVAGQVYVGTGYREMAEATKSTAISVTCVSPIGEPSSKENLSLEFE